MLKLVAFRFFFCLFYSLLIKRVSLVTFKLESTNLYILARLILPAAFISSNSFVIITEG